MDRVKAIAVAIPAGMAISPRAPFIVAAAWLLPDLALKWLEVLRQWLDVVERWRR